MKFQSKARIALAAVAALAIAGGAAAVNANAKRGLVVYTTNALGAPAIHTVTNAFTSTTGSLTFASTIYRAPAVSTRTTISL